MLGENHMKRKKELLKKQISDSRMTKSERKELIRLVTYDLINEYGYANVSTNQIAKESNVNISLIYRDFPNGKPDILISMQESFEVNIKEVSLPDNVPPNILLNELITKTLKHHENQKNMLRAITIAYHSDPSLFGDNQELLTNQLNQLYIYESLVSKILKKSIKEVKEDAKIVFHIIDGLIHRQILSYPIYKEDDKFIIFLSNLVMAYLQRKSD